MAKKRKTKKDDGCSDTWWLEARVHALDAVQSIMEALSHAQQARDFIEDHGANSKHPSVLGEVGSYLRALAGAADAIESMRDQLEYMP